LEQSLDIRLQDRLIQRFSLLGGHFLEKRSGRGGSMTLDVNPAHHWSILRWGLDPPAQHKGDTNTEHFQPEDVHRLFLQTNHQKKALISALPICRVGRPGCERKE
jgi:hypothetical protein